MMRPWHEWAAALGWMSRLPVGDGGSAIAPSAALRWVPWTGWVLGGLLAAGAWALQQLSLQDPWIPAWLMLVAWVWITGGMHLDGLADLADGLGAAHREPVRILVVMKAPEIGVWGAVALILVLAGKLVFLHACLESRSLPTGLLLACIWGRWSAWFWAQQLRPLQSEGLGAMLHEVDCRPGWWAGIAGVALTLWLMPFALAALVPVAAFSVWIQRRLGGMNGDVLGAGIEMTELTVLLLAAWGA